MGIFCLSLGSLRQERSSNDKGKSTVRDDRRRAREKINLRINEKALVRS